MSPQALLRDNFTDVVNCLIKAERTALLESGGSEVEGRYKEPDYSQQEPCGECELPKSNTAPENIVLFHQIFSLPPTGTLTPTPSTRDLALACAPLSRLDLSFGIIQRYEQHWKFLCTEIGSPVSYVGLAPLERRRVEVGYKRKTNLSRSDSAKRSSRLTLDSSTSTKASSNTTAASVSRLNWSASASGSYGVGAFRASASANIGGALEQHATVPLVTYRMKLPKAVSKFKQKQKQQQR